MGMLDHWHPMFPSARLRSKPVGVCLGGREIALFRTSQGQVGALDDMCPHRRMRLSRGSVVGDKLMCMYHGWTFDCAGKGESPGTPKLHACASTFDACEKYGYIWVKSKDSSPILPTFDAEGWCRMGAVEVVAAAPLDLTVDNFCEIEHTPTIHKLFGYDLDRMKDVSVRFETTDDTVTVINQGPAKPINFILRYLIGIKKHFVFNDVWTTHFSPVYSVYDHFWSDPESGEEAWVRWRIYIFFTPLTENQTRVTAFTYAKSKWPFPPHGGLLPFRGYMTRKVREEVDRDVSLLVGLSSLNPSLDGMKLSRLDKALGLNRERIERVYRGKKAEPPERQLKIAQGE
jgi:phenylpropionate dioxygenase-like ring-hydroxylating dioxygenase large terminal subunit